MLRILLSLIAGSVGLAALAACGLLAWMLWTRPGTPAGMLTVAMMMIAACGAYLLRFAVRTFGTKGSLLSEPGLGRERLLHQVLLGATIALGVMTTTHSQTDGFLSLFAHTLAHAALLIAGIFLSIGWHECGHLVASYAVRARPYLVRIGTGREWWSLQTGPVKWSLGCNMFNGYVLAHPAGERWERGRMLAFVAGGPIATLAGILYLAWYGGPSLDSLKLPQESLWQTGVGFLFWGNVVILLSCLIPYRMTVDGMVLQTDLSLMLSCLFASRERWAEMTNPTAALHELLRTGRAREAWKLAKPHLRTVPEIADLLLYFSTTLGADEAPALEKLAGDTMAGSQLEADQRSKLLGAMGAVHAQLGRPAEARALLAEAFSTARSTEAKIAFCEHVANLVIQAQLTEYLPEADEYSLAALALQPGVVTLEGTRASILAERGRLEEAARMLEDVFRRTASDHDRGICAFYLAMVHRRRGENDEINRWLEEMRRHAPPLWLVERARADGLISPEKSV